MAFTKILGPGIHTLANFHSHNINSSGIITATKFVGDMEPGGGTGSFDSLTVTGNLGVGGTVTYTDVTNVDAIGIITAQSGIYIGAGATVGSFNTTTGISSFKTLNVDETSTLNGSVGIADSIIHIGNTDTSIRFPSDDTFTIETAGSEALRIDSTGRLLLNTTTEGNPNADDFTISFNNTGVSGGDQGRCGMSIRSGNNTSGVTQPGYIYFSDGTSGDNESKGAIAYDHNVDDMYLATDGVERLRIGSTGISTFLKDLHVAQSGTGSTVFINSTTHNTSVASIAMLKLGYTHSGGQAVGYLKLEEGGGNSFDGNLTVGVPYNQGSGNFATRDALTVKFSGDVDLYGATAGVTSCFWDASANTLIFNDDVTAAFGNGSDLKIYHNHQHSYIDETGTGNLYIRNGTKNSIWCETDGQVNLYHNDSAKLSTSSTGITVTGEVAASQDYPNIRPVLDFNFAVDKKLDPRITYTRTGPASYYDEFGKVVLVGDNAPRFDHDLTTRESKGLLLEETRTNLFLYGTTPGDNWTGSKAGTFEENTTETTAPDGTFTATKWTFTTTDPYLYQTTTLGANTTYTMSMWVKAGTNMSGDVLQFRLGAAPYSTFGNSRLSEDGSWKRITYTKTVGGSNENSASVGFEPQTHPSGNPAVGDVIYIWGAQLEVGGFVTSFIPTNGSTAARGVDLCQITGEDFSDFYNQSEGTIVSEHSIATGVASGDNTYVYQVDDGSDTNVEFRLIDHNSAHGDVLRAYGFTGGSWSSPLYGSETSTPDHDSFLRVAVGVKKDDFGVNFFGGTTSTDTSGDINVDMTQLTLGNHRGGTAPLQGYLRRFIYYPQKLTTNQLKTITTS